MRYFIYILSLFFISFSSSAQIITKKLFVTGCDDCDVNLYGGGINLDGNSMFNAYTNTGIGSPQDYFTQELLPSGNFQEHLPNTSNPRGKGAFLGLFNGMEIYAPFPTDSGFHYYEYTGQVLTKVRLPASNPDSLGKPIISKNRAGTAIAFLTDDSLTVKTANSSFSFFADSTEKIFLSDHYLYSIRSGASTSIPVFDIANEVPVDTINQYTQNPVKTSPITGELMFYDSQDSYFEWSDTGFIHRSFPQVYAKRPVMATNLVNVDFIRGNGNTFYVNYYSKALGFFDGVTFDTAQLNEFYISTSSVEPFRTFSSGYFVDTGNVLHIPGGSSTVSRRKFLTVSPLINFAIGTAKPSAPATILTTKGNTLYTVGRKGILKTTDFENLQTVFEFKNGEIGSSSSIGRGVISKEGHLLFRVDNFLYRIQNGVLDTLFNDVREFDLDTNTNRLVYITNSDQKLLSLIYPTLNPTSISESNTQYFGLALDEKRKDIRVLEKDVNNNYYATRLDSLGIRHKTPVSIGINYLESEAYDGLYVPSARVATSVWYMRNDSIISQTINHCRIDKNGKVISMSDGDILIDFLNEKRLIRNTTPNDGNEIIFNRNNFEIGERYLYTSISDHNGTNLIRFDYKFMVPEIQVLDIGNYKLPISSHGNHAVWDRLNYRSEYPKGAGFGTMDQLNQAFSALTGDSTEVHSNRSTRENFTEDGAWGTNPSNISGQGVFKINRTEIENHINNYNSPNYVMPLAFLLWPAHGLSEAGEATCIAPFTDRNNNGYYDPKNGDTPFIKGHQAIYTIHHSLRTQGKEGAFEIHNMYYGYDTTDLVLNNTIFVDTRVINKSDQTLFKPALATSQHGAYYERDSVMYNHSYVGTDSLLQMPYTYVNPDNNADTLLPATGFMALNDTIDFALGFIKWGAFYEWGQDQKTTRANQLGYYANGITKYPLRYKMTFPVLDTDTTKLITNYMFTGFPEYGIGWLPDNNMAYNSRMMYSVLTDRILPGDTFSVETAYILSLDSIGGHKESIALLRQRAAQLKTWYAQNKVEWPAGPCSGIPASTQEQREISTPDWKMYPNPTQELLTIDWPNAQTRANIYGITGRLILSTQIKEGINTLDVSTLNEGVYIVQPEGKVGVRKLVIR